MPSSSQPPSQTPSLMSLAPRVRHRKPSVELNQAPDPVPRLFSKAQEITVKFSNLTNDELELLKTIAHELPSMVASIRAEHKVERISQLGSSLAAQQLHSNDVEMFMSKT